MTFPALKEAQGKLDGLRKELFDVFREAGPDRDMDKVTSLQGDSAAKVEWIQNKNTELEAAKREVDKLLAVERAAANSESTESGAETEAEDQRPEKRETRSIGEMFVKSQAFKGYHRGADGPSVTLDIDVRNTLFETGAGWAPESTRTGRVEMYPTRPAPHVVDFFPQTTTTQSAIKYMEETTFTNNAAEKNEGDTYAEVALALTQRTVDVEKVTAWIPATDEQFEDEPRARDYVNNRLVFMLQQRVDLQALTGTGISPLLKGTESVTGIQTQALAGDNTQDAIYKLFVLIRSDGFAEPSVVFIQPGKFQTVRLDQTADGIYIWGHPSVPGPFTMWGVPVVETMAVTSTKAVAGDYANFSEIAIRRGIDVQVTNSHGEYFTAGKLAIRADVRLAVVHYRPKAFGTVTGL